MYFQKGLISDMSMDEHDVISAQDLQFGDYSSGTENGKEKASVNSQSNSTPARIPVLNASQDSEDDHFSDHDDKSNLLSPETAKSKQRFLSFEYYQSFFDVETHHVLTRMQASVILSWRNNFVKHYLRPNPDLYGPFWIAATLVFAIAINGNFSSLVKNYSGSGKNSTQKVTSQWAYDLDTISTAGLIMSLYLVCVPTLYWLFLRWRKSLNMFTLLEIVSLYGYSLTIFLPASLLWLIPVVAVQWSVSIVALLISSAALCLALWPSLQEEDMPVSFGTLTAVVLLQGLLVICFMVSLNVTSFGDLPIAASFAENSTTNGSESNATSSLANISSNQSKLLNSSATNHAKSAHSMSQASESSI